MFVARLKIPTAAYHSSYVFRRRSGSTSANPFPYPTHVARPTPHQIFHLPPSATQADVKARCKHFYTLSLSLLSYSVLLTKTNSNKTNELIELEITSW
ncbi:hypothetical protein BC835DRAFT_1378184 [Cytidiella melzeri]|nr:hypothetical protein BC835DRAFT_1378184 [Cytidiella melzeri]